MLTPFLSCFLRLISSHSSRVPGGCLLRPVAQLSACGVGGLPGRACPPLAVSPFLCVTESCVGNANQPLLFLRQMGPKGGLLVAGDIFQLGIWERGVCV